MLALYRSGRQADALREYERARAVLRDEVGIEPGPELRRLELAILQQDPQLLRTTALGDEWQPTSSFVGREADLARLTRRWSATASSPSVGPVAWARRASSMSSRAGAGCSGTVLRVSLSGLELPERLDVHWSLRSWACSSRSPIRSST